jgi:hypothetical protein
MYYKQMRKLKLILWLKNSNLNVNAELTQISRFVNLEELDLTIEWFETNEIMFDKEFKLIGKKCKNLKSLRIECREVFKMKVFENFMAFKNFVLKYLKKQIMRT